MTPKIAIFNLRQRPLSSMLTAGLIAFSVGIISLLMLMQRQMEDKFQNDLRDIDLVVGAKGSPLQLVLSAVYHLDAPTGNISVADAQPLMNGPMIEDAIPLAYGDAYEGFRIVGTTDAYLKKYDAFLQQGRLFHRNMDAVIGATVAKKTNLAIGESFFGVHGEAAGGHIHDDEAYTVTGILNATGSVIDQLILTNIASVWQVHHHKPNHAEDEKSDHHDAEDQNEKHHTHNTESPDSGEETHDHHNDLQHDHFEKDKHDREEQQNHKNDTIEALFNSPEADSMQLTALLLKYKSKMTALNMPRIINEQTEMQAVMPALEINRLFYMIGIGANTLQLLAGGIMLMSAFSVFLVLFNRLRDRRYELALLRAVGYRPRHLFLLLLLEGFFLAIAGYGIGLALSRLGLFQINRQSAGDFNFQFSLQYHQEEGWILLLTLLVGISAAIIPAFKAMRLDVSAALSGQPQ